MTTNEKVARRKRSLLELATELGDVSKGRLTHYPSGIVSRLLSLYSLERTPSEQSGRIGYAISFFID